ncbi:MAG: iron ABC transporter substrate-binding protein [Firmicutes bacterium]|nr:iron ABC transporter substrate-binding protein [Bacillota bacterium]
MVLLRSKTCFALFFTILIMMLSLNPAAGLAQSGVKAVIDMAGRRVVLPSVINRVVGIGAGALRLLVYLDAVEMVAGVEDIEQRGLTKPYLMAHPELAKLPSIGPAHGGDPELIVARKPDVIFWTYTNAGYADSLQRRTGIPVVVLNYGDLANQKATFFKALHLIAEVLNKQARADKLIAYIEAAIQDLERRTNRVPNTEKVYVGGVAHRGSHGITSTEPLYAPFMYVKATNVGSGIGLEHAYIDKEQLIQWNPDKIFIDSSGYNQVVNELAPGSVLAETLKAVKNNELYMVLPYNYYTTNFETVLANAYYVGKVLYPDQFKDIDPAKTADRIYGFFVGKGVYSDMQKLYGGFRKLKLR